MGGSGDVEVVPAGVQGHDHLLHRGVACPFTYSVDAALHLAGAGFDRSDAVRDGQPQVVMAVDAEHSLMDVGDVLLYIANKLGELGGNGVTYGVRDVDGGGAGVDNPPQ